MEMKQMRKFLIVPAAALGLAAIVGTTFASDGEGRASAPRDQWMSTEAVKQKLTADGYEVRRIKTDDGRYEVYAKDKDGKRVERYVDPVTGAFLKGEREDD
jgi:hypothetical protein